MAIVYARKGVWLYSASAVSLVAGLMCSESVHFRGFWPEFWAVLSLGLLLTSLICSVEERTAEEEAGGRESRQEVSQ